MALYTFTSQDDFAKLNRLPMPTPDQTQLYNALGRGAGAQDSQGGGFDPLGFLKKKGSSIENAISSTVAAPVSFVKDSIQNANMDKLMSDNKTRMNDIYKKYGYEDSNAYYDAKNANESNVFSKYGFNPDDFWNKRAEADLKGNKAEIERLEKERANVISRMSAEDADSIRRFDNIQEELKGQASANSAAVKKSADEYKDWVDNNYLSKKLQQDRGKYLGSAINTLSTATDLLGLTSGPVSNAIQGGIEGIADELEQNGLDNFSWERAGQNALSGAASGAAAGALNSKLDSVLGGMGRKATQGAVGGIRGAMKNFGDSAIGSTIKNVGKGVARGAASGAVGGAAGAGVSAAMNGGDILGSAIEGAKQGLLGGATAGGIMTGVNAALNKTPGVGRVLQESNQAANDFRNRYESGDGNRLQRFGNAIAETANSGDSGVGNIVDNLRSSVVNRKAVDRLSNALDAAQNGGNNGDVKFVRMTNELLDEFNDIRTRSGLEPLTDRQVIAYENAINKNLVNRANEGMSTRDVAQMAYNALTSDNSKAVPGYYENQIAVSSPGIINDYDGAVIGRASDGNTSLKSIEPRTRSQIGMLENQGQQKIGPKSQLGSLPVDEQPVNNSIVPQGEQNVNLLLYGESNLGNRTKRGMIADSLERFGNTLEGAQTNITRAAAKDLGIESSGKVIENVRKKTGLTNLETQASLARELTGGENSLLDSIQRRALGASETGKPYEVDTTPVLNKIDQIVNSIADTNMFGSQAAKDRFINNLKMDVSSFEGDVLSIANRMKANAADLRGKGVASPTPADSAKAKIYTKVANELDDLSYKAIPQDNVDAMFETAISEMRGRAAQAYNNGNKDIAKAYNMLADSLEAEPRTIKAYRSFKKDFVDASKINDLTAQAENGAAMQMGRGFGGGVKRLADTLLQRPVNAALAKAGSIANMAAGALDRGGDTSVVRTSISGPKAPVIPSAQTQIYDLIGRNEGLSNAEQARTANYLTEAVQETQQPTAQTLEQLVAPNSGVSNGSNSVYNSIYGTPNANTTSANSGATNTGYFPQTGDYWTDIIASAMSAAIDADDVNAFASLYGMYQDSVAKLQKQAESANKSTSQKFTATQQRANAAMNSLNRLSSMNPDLGYNLSGIPIIGDIATFGGNDYESEAGSLAQQIGYMVSGANIKEDEARNIGKAYVPQPWDSEQTRRNKLMRARQIIQNYQAGTVDEVPMAMTY